MEKKLLQRRTFQQTNTPGIVTDQNGQPCIDIKMIVVATDRGRQDFGRVLELRDSMLQFGVLHPIKLRKVLKKDYDGKNSLDWQYHLVAGGRRYRAFLTTGETYIPFTFEGEDNLWAAEAELEENIQRLGLSNSEECILQAKIHDLKTKKYGNAVKGQPNTEFGWSLDKQAALTQQSSESVRTKVKLGKAMLKDPSIQTRLGHLPASAMLKELTKETKTKDFHEKLSTGSISVQGSIKNIDCLAGLKDLASASVHCVLTDPPFGNSQITQDTGSTRSSMTYTGVIKPTDNMTSEAVRTLLSQVIPELGRVLVPGGHLYLFFAFEHYNFLVKTLTVNGFLVEDQPLIWYKNATTTPAMGYNYPSSYEPILFAHNKERSRRLTGEGLRNLLTIPAVPRNDRKHPFHKPAKLIIDLIARSTVVGETVLDPFAGSGEVVKRATQLQRNALGFEVNPDNWARAQMNLSEAASATPKSGIGGKA